MTEDSLKSTPAFTKVRSVLAVPNLDASVDFYTRQLGMAIDFTAPGWAFLSRGNFRLMLGECADALPAHALGDHSYFVYVTVEGIDALYAEFGSRNIDFTQPLASKPWGMREFGVRTPDGHRIMFGQEL
jgi:catechol 2,3-dioxygenase-like lactoylglutathione lyase family enzyme